MIEKLECTCIEAYTTRKMRDPNCCACSCDHNDLVDQLAKANEAASFYKEQYEKVDRECTKLAMREAKANERVKELESENEGFKLRISKKKEIIARYAKEAIETAKAQEKFAIEKEIKGLKDYQDMCGFADCRKSIDARIAQLEEQLRKEQE